MHFTYGPHRVEVTGAASPQAAQWEQELAAAGFRLPFPHRMAAAELEPDPGPLLFMIRHGSGTVCGGFAVQRRTSHALPGHSLLRVERFGAALPDGEARASGVRALADFSRASPRVLRTYLGVFSPDPGVQQEIAAHAAAAGFQKNPDRRGYSSTLVVDLRPDEETIFASLHATARRHIRAAAKHPVAVRPVDAPELAGRLDALVGETFARTGGDVERFDWPRLIQFASRHPELSRIVGLFRTDRTGPDSLLAFAHGLHHGDCAEYSTAASTRDTDVRLPQMYVLAWDLFRWAKAHGAAFFDFGGITPVVSDGSDPLQGISAFKRYFSKEEITVGDEWILEPSRLKANLARVVTSVANSVARS
jgi:hypothetical protein